MHIYQVLSRLTGNIFPKVGLINHGLNVSCTIKDVVEPLEVLSMVEA